MSIVAYSGKSRAAGLDGLKGSLGRCTTLDVGWYRVRVWNSFPTRPVAVVARDAVPDADPVPVAVPAAVPVSAAVPVAVTGSTTHHRDLPEWG